jgi:hypothetical protein
MKRGFWKMRYRSGQNSVQPSGKSRQPRMLRQLRELLRGLLELTRERNRVNYKQMSQISYSALRQQDWYANQQRATHIEDRRFWCPEQLYIFQDIFVPMSKPIHPASH